MRTSGYHVPEDASIRTADEDTLFLEQKRDATTQTTDEDFLFLEGKRDKSTQTNDEDFILLIKAKDAETQTSEEDFELIRQITSGGFASTVASKTLQKNKRKIISGGSDVNKRSRTEVDGMSKVISTSSDTVPMTSDSHIDISASSGQTGMEESHSTGISPEYLNIEESYQHSENIPSYLVNKRILNRIENDELSTNTQKENATHIITDSEEKVKSSFLVAGVAASCEDVPQTKLCADNFKTESPLNLETMCNVCKEIFECKMKLADHYLTHEEFHEIFCRICHSEIDKHELMKGKREYQCCECAFRTDSKVHLQLHLYVHSPLKLFKCEYCGKRFKQTKGLRDHFKNLHPVCELCGKRFDNNNSLDKHRLEEHSKT